MIEFSSQKIVFYRVFLSDNFARTAIVELLIRLCPHLCGERAGGEVEMEATIGPPTLTLHTVFGTPTQRKNYGDNIIIRR